MSLIFPITGNSLALPPEALIIPSTINPSEGNQTKSHKMVERKERAGEMKANRMPKMIRTILAPASKMNKTSPWLAWKRANLELGAASRGTRKSNQM